MTDEELIYSIIKDCWGFIKKNLRAVPKDADDWGFTISGELHGILLKYYDTPLKNFSIDIFTAALTELERRDKHDH